MRHDEEMGKKDLKTQYTLEITPEGLITGTNDSVGLPSAKLPAVLPAVLLY